MLFNFIRLQSVCVRLSLRKLQNRHHPKTLLCEPRKQSRSILRYPVGLTLQTWNAKGTMPKVTDRFVKLLTWRSAVSWQAKAQTCSLTFTDVSSYLGLEWLQMTPDFILEHAKLWEHVPSLCLLQPPLLPYSYVLHINMLIPISTITFFAKCQGYWITAESYIKEGRGRNN